jgi:hypothetical protein
MVQNSVPTLKCYVDDLFESSKPVCIQKYMEDLVTSLHSSGKLREHDDSSAQITLEEIDFKFAGSCSMSETQCTLPNKIDEYEKSLIVGTSGTIEFEPSTTILEYVTKELQG